MIVADDDGITVKISSWQLGDDLLHEYSGRHLHRIELGNYLVVAVCSTSKYQSVQVRQKIKKRKYFLVISTCIHDTESLPGMGIEMGTARVVTSLQQANSIKVMRHRYENNLFI